MPVFTSYATPADVYAFLSAQAFVVRGRPPEAVDALTGAFLLTAHGLDADDVVLLTATSGGSLPVTLNAWLNTALTKLNSHYVDTGSHTIADGADVVSSVTYPTAINEATRVARVNAICAAYELHRAKGSGALIHINAPGDTTSALSITTPATDDESALARALDLDAAAALHFAGTTWHTIADSDVIAPSSISGLVYLAVLVDGSDVFRLVEPVLGGPVAPLFSTGFLSGRSTFVARVDQERKLRRHLRDAAGRINQKLTAHSAPILVDPITGEYPPVIVGINARMAGRSHATSLEFENPAYRKSADRLFALEKSDDAQLEDYKAGIPIAPQPVDQTSVADNAARASSSGSLVPWTQDSL